MKVFLLVLAGLAALTIRSVYADTRTPPEATQHALDELANAIAQGKTTLTPTPTPSPTSTATATPTPSPTATPEPDQPTVTPTTLPALPALAADSDPLAAYIRPSTTDQSWLELALPQGRWDFQFDTPACVPLDAWSNVWLAAGVVPPLLVARDDSQNAAMCGVAQSLWHSDVPCAMTDGECDVEADAVYWAVLTDLAPSSVTDVQPTDALWPAPTAIPRSVAPVSQPRPPASAPQVVVQTVVIVVTPVPTQTPIPTAGPKLLAVVPTGSDTLANPTLSPIPTPRATPRPLRMVVGATSTAAPMPTREPITGADSRPEAASLDWRLVGVIALALSIGVAGIWIVSRRRLAVW